MTAMTAPATPIGLPYGRALTRDDLAAMPDDGHRYELIDGTLIVTPAPGYDHQSGVLELAVLLRSGCPAELKVMIAPFDVVFGKKTVLQPDLLVARRSDFTARDLPKVPVLAVEILSPSTRHIDLGLKRSRYEAAGCPSYWVIDPSVPSITAWELADGKYELVGEVKGEEPLRLSNPYPIEIVPAQLLDG